MSSTIDISVWLKIQGFCTLLQLPSNFLVAIARGQTETCASYPYQQQFSCFENESGRIRQQLFCCRNRKVASARLASLVRQIPPVSFRRLAGTRFGIAAASDKQYGRDRRMAIHMGGFSLWQGEACLLLQEFTRHFIIAIEKAIPM
jgi:hypothetical protein